MNRRCDTCVFWIKHDYQKDNHPEDYHGDCHRHAPSPTLGDYQHEVMKHLTIISWGYATDEQKKDDFGKWEEFHAEQSWWPVTTASDWCGDWQRKKGE